MGYRILEDLGYIQDLKSGRAYYIRRDGTFLDDVGDEREVSCFNFGPELPTKTLKLISIKHYLEPPDDYSVTVGNTYHIIGDMFRDNNNIWRPPHYFEWEELPEVVVPEVIDCGYTMCHDPRCIRCYPKPDKSQARKDTPVFSGFLAYFPLAAQEVSRLSKIGNDKHNPGQPLHWSKDKSTDHADCIIRHQLEFDQVDEDTGLLHAVSVAWRAMAQLETLLEAE